MTHRKRTSILLVISFVLILVGSFFSNAINTDFGKIKTDRLYLMNDNGYTVSARIYIPKTATQEAPAPAMIICPGGDSPSDLLTPWASEIARRGFVVALVDYTAVAIRKLIMLRSIGRTTVLWSWKQSTTIRQIGHS